MINWIKRSYSAFKLKNSAGTVINPATEDTLLTLATESTLNDVLLETQDISAQQTDNSQTTQVVGVDYVSGLSGVDASTEVLETIEYEHHEIHSNSHYFIEDFTTMADEAVLDFCFTTAAGAKWVHMVFAFDSDGTMQLDMYENADLDPDGTLVVQRGNNRALCFSGTHTVAGTSATVMTDAAATFTIDALIGWKIYNVTDGSYGIVTDNDGTTVTVAALIGGTGNEWDQNDEYEINRSLSIVESGCTVNDVGFRLGGQSGGSATNVNKGVPGGQQRSNEFVLRPGTAYLFRFTSGLAANKISYVSEFYEHTDRN